MLCQNLKYLRNQIGVSQTQMAQTIGISRTTLAGYEQGRSKPKTNILEKISTYFKVNIDDLLKSDITTSSHNQQGNSNLKSLDNKDFRVVAITVQNNQKPNIEYVPITAIAGYSKNFSNPTFIGDLPLLSIPKLAEGTYRAFEIKGDSMPPIEEGFIVIGKFIEHATDLINGKRYVFVLKDDGVVFKRVTNEVSQNRHLILNSDNPEYSSYSVKISEVLEAWELVCFIGYPTKINNSEHAIIQKLNSIEHKLEHLLVKKTDFNN